MSAEPSREYSGRICAWCRGPISPATRRDAICCSTRCRQARNRFVQGVGVAAAGVTGGQPLRLAYADPPYPGLSRKYYAGHPDYAGEVDHAALIASLAAEYDGWALSTSAAALRDVWSLCPRGTRLAIWVRGERPNTRSRGPQNAYEPVLFAGGRLRVAAAGQDDTSRPAGGPVAQASSTRREDPRDVRDRHATAPHLVNATRLEVPDDAAVTRDASRSDPQRVDGRRLDVLTYRPGVRRTDPARVIGAKPAPFIRWIFDLLGALPGDELVDVFPGSGGVDRAWKLYTGQGGV